MMRHAIIAVLFCQTVLSMDTELTNCYQKQLLIQEKAKEKTPLMRKALQKSKINFSQLRFHQIDIFLRDLPEGCIQKVKKQLPTGMSFLCDVAISLPRDITNIIILFMCDKDKKAAENFCTLSLDEAHIFLMFGGHKQAIKKFYELPEREALQLYHEIKKALGNSKQPVGPLYEASEIDRNIVLQRLNPGFFSYPSITLGEKKNIDRLGTHLKEYVSGKEVVVVEGLEKSDIEIIRIWCCISCGIPLIAGGCVFATGAACGACAPAGAGIVCDPIFLKYTLGIFGAMAGFLGSTACWCTCRPWCKAERITL